MEQQEVEVAATMERERFARLNATRDPDPIPDGNRTVVHDFDRSPERRIENGPQEEAVRRKQSLGLLELDEMRGLISRNLESWAFSKGTGSVEDQRVLLADQMECYLAMMDSADFEDERNVGDHMASSIASYAWLVYMEGRRFSTLNSAFTRFWWDRKERMRQPPAKEAEEAAPDAAGKGEGEGNGAKEEGDASRAADA